MFPYFVYSSVIYAPEILFVILIHVDVGIVVHWFSVLHSILLQTYVRVHLSVLLLRDIRIISSSLLYLTAYVLQWSYACTYAIFYGICVLKSKRHYKSVLNLRKLLNFSELNILCNIGMIILTYYIECLQRENRWYIQCT